MNKAREQLIREVCDPNKVILICGKHGYAAGGSKPPTYGCKQCWQAYLVHQYAKCPPAQREQKLEELETIIRHLAEDCQRGEMNFQLHDSPELKYEKDVPDDVIEAEKHKSITEA
jgi:hypothetical protein